MPLEVLLIGKTRCSQRQESQQLHIVRINNEREGARIRIHIMEWGRKFGVGWKTGFNVYIRSKKQELLNYKWKS